MLGMILAAGLGTRMRPLSDQTPKPCMPVCGRPLIHYAIDLLKTAAVRESAVNLHHLGDHVRTLLREGPRLGMRFRFSDEPEILGTGGGVRRGWEVLMDGMPPDEPLAVVNTDTILAADLAPIAADHEKSGALATLVLTRDAAIERYGAVRFDSTGRVVDIAGLAGADVSGCDGAVYSGVSILDPSLFPEMPPGGSYCLVRDVLVPQIQRGGRIRAVVADGAWLDAGEPADYLTANRRMLETATAAFGRANPAGQILAMHFPVGDRVFAAPMAKIEMGVGFAGPALIQLGARIESEAHVGPNAIVGRKAVIGRGARIENVVVWNDAAVAEGAELSNCVVTPAGVFPV